MSGRLGRLRASAGNFGQQGTGTAGNGFVDHCSIHGDGGIAAHEGLLVGVGHLPGPYQLLILRAEGAIGEGDLRRVDAELS